MNKYYVYVHINPMTKTVFYVGKGQLDRAWDYYGRNVFWKRVYNKYGVDVDIVSHSLNEKDAFDLEQLLILEYRDLGINLTNLSNGGEGSSGLRFTDQQRLNISNSLKGRLPWNKGKCKSKTKEYKLPEEIRLKLSRAKIGKYLGNKNPFADLNEYTFVRLVDGFEVTCTRSDLCKNFGVSNSYIEKLFYKNNPRKSTSGWRLK